MYQAFVCRLQNVRPHPNADRIKLATVYGNQVVVGLDQVDDELGVYFPTDGQLTEVFCSENNLFRHSHLNKDKEKSGYFDDNRRIRTQKFRGEESDGLWMPITCLDFLGDAKLKEGDSFNTIAGTQICHKYITKKSAKTFKGKNKLAKAKDMYPQFREHIETQQLAFFAKDIPTGSFCTISEKLHGTSGRTSYTRVEQKPWLFGLIKRPAKYEYVTGSRRVILNFERGTDPGYYGTNRFRKQIHDWFSAGFLRKGETIYYEIVGWIDKDRPIMPPANNNKLKDKKFTKRYGDQTYFNYGCTQGTYKIYVYRMNMTSPDGHVVEYSTEQIKKRCSIMGLEMPPQLHSFLYHKIHKDDRENAKEIMDKINAYLSGADQLPASSYLDNSHIMEGVVLRVENANDFVAYKHKSFHFKVLEGIIKDSGAEDIEEAS